MLADAQISAQAGSLGGDVHLPATSLFEMLNFIGSELPVWRDRKDRPMETAETALTSQLCAHLNSASRHSSGWDMLQFRVEETDAAVRARKVDLIAAPSDCVIWVDGRKHTDFDALVPIECKRLPIPKDASRDEREYVFSSTSSTGGIQRFKEGNHGAAYGLGGMIGYIQADDASRWTKEIETWVDGLVTAKQAGWSKADHLELEDNSAATKTTRLKSKHTRNGGLPDIHLRHLWVEMS
jgi:hypothetical protein